MGIPEPQPPVLDRGDGSATCGPTTPRPSRWAWRPSDRTAERVAGARIASPIAGLEPLLPFRRRAVRPCLAIHVPLKLALDAIVAHRGCSAQGVSDVLIGDAGDIACLDGIRRPDAGEAIRLCVRPDPPRLGPLP